jgi:hypothetical protein
LFAYQKKQQAGLFLKDLIPLAAIGRAYVWRAGLDAPGLAKLCVSAACGNSLPTGLAESKEHKTKSKEQGGQK